jgi:hypothetical protein
MNSEQTLEPQIHTAGCCGAVPWKLSPVAPPSEWSKWMIWSPVNIYVRSTVVLWDLTFSLVYYFLVLS